MLRNRHLAALYVAYSVLALGGVCLLVPTIFLHGPWWRALQASIVGPWAVLYLLLYRAGRRHGASHAFFGRQMRIQGNTFRLAARFAFHDTPPSKGLLRSPNEL